MSIISKFKQYRSNQKKQGSEDQKDADKKPGEDKEMSFLDHLEELRWHLVRSFIAIGIVGIVIFIYRRWVMDNVILAPFDKNFPVHKFLCQLNAGMCTLPEIEKVALGPLEQFMMAIKLGFVGGFVVAFPYVLWEIWRFLKPGFHAHEKTRFRGGVFVLSLLFFIGVLFAYYIISPFSIQFLGNFQLTEQVVNQWKIGKIISLMVQIPIAGGVMFELPVIVYVLSKMGLITPEFMKKYRRHAFVVMLILAAILTPPDVTSQILIFIPLFILYQISIGISARVNKKREAELRGDVKDEA